MRASRGRFSQARVQGVEQCVLAPGQECPGGVQMEPDPDRVGMARSQERVCGEGVLKGPGERGVPVDATLGGASRSPGELDLGGGDGRCRPPKHARGEEALGERAEAPALDADLEPGVCGVEGIGEPGQALARCPRRTERIRPKGPLGDADPEGVARELSHTGGTK